MEVWRSKLISGHGDNATAIDERMTEPKAPLRADAEPVSFGICPQPFVMVEAASARVDESSPR